MRKPKSKPLMLLVEEDQMKPLLPIWTAIPVFWWRKPGAGFIQVGASVAATSSAKLQAYAGSGPHGSASYKPRKNIADRINPKEDPPGDFQGGCKSPLNVLFAYFLSHHRT